jgi:hypothetical protein
LQKSKFKISNYVFFVVANWTILAKNKKFIYIKREKYALFLLYASNKNRTEREREKKKRKPDNSYQNRPK